MDRHTKRVVRIKIKQEEEIEIAFCDEVENYPRLSKRSIWGTVRDFFVQLIANIFGNHL